MTSASDGMSMAFASELRVGEAETVQRLFSLLPHGVSYAHRMAPVMATGALLAAVESVCVLAMQEQLGAEETVVGTHVQLHHVGPALPGSLLFLRGRGEPGPDGATRFDVVVDDAHERVATATLCFAVLSRARYLERLNRKGRCMA